jgi:predicted aspartyl protease
MYPWFVKSAEWCRLRTLVPIVVLTLVVLAVTFGVRKAVKHTDKIKQTSELQNLFEMFPTNMTFASDPNRVVVPFRVVNGMIVVRATLDGVSLDAIVDTGAMTVALPKPIGKHPPNIIGRGKIIDANCKPSDARIALIPTMSLGSYSVRNLPAMISSLRPTKRSLLGEMPLLGMACFRNVSLTINYKSQQIIIQTNADKLFSAKRSVGDIRFARIRSQHQVNGPLWPVVPVTLNGVTKPLLLDTGAPECEVIGNTAEFRLKPVGGCYRIKGGYSSSVLCDYITNVPMVMDQSHRRINVMGDPAPGSGPLLGYIFLREYVVTIDSAGDRILLQKQNGVSAYHGPKPIVIRGPYKPGTTTTTTYPGGVTVTVTVPPTPRPHAILPVAKAQRKPNSRRP